MNTITGMNNGSLIENGILIEKMIGKDTERRKKMKEWSISVGQGGPNIDCDEMPLWVYLLEKLTPDLCCTVLLRWKDKEYTFHDIPLPKWPTWYDKYLECQENPQEYWGDLGSIIDYTFIEPIRQF